MLPLIFFIFRCCVFTAALYTRITPPPLFLQQNRPTSDSRRDGRMTPVSRLLRPPINCLWREVLSEAATHTAGLAGLMTSSAAGRVFSTVISMLGGKIGSSGGDLIQATSVSSVHLLSWDIQTVILPINTIVFISSYHPTHLRWFHSLKIISLLQ